MKDIWKEITKEDLEQEFANGLWHKDIAEKYEVSSRAVYDKVKKLNVDIERKNKSKLKDKVVICPVCGKEYKSLIGEICGSCKSKQIHSEDQFSIETDSEIGKQIIELRKQGLSYENIAKQVGCCKSTVSYHCKNQTRVKTSEKRERQRNEEPWKFYFSRRVSVFRTRKKRSVAGYTMCKNWRKKFSGAVLRFKKRNDMIENYDYLEALEHVGGVNTHCYLTGLPINIKKDDYQLDHILPVSKGGTNELSNMAIATIEANQMKGGLTNEELFYWCQKILEHNGYTVIKNENIETQSE